MSARSNPIRLTPTQKWEVAKYCIEHKGVLLTLAEPEKYKMRMFVGSLAREFSEANFKIKPNHIKDSLNFYFTVCELTNNLPVIPKEATVEEDILKIDITKKELIIKDLQDQVKTLNDVCETYRVTVANYKERFTQIRKLGSV